MTGQPTQMEMEGLQHSTKQHLDSTSSHSHFSITSNHIPERPDQYLSTQRILSPQGSTQSQVVSNALNVAIEVTQELTALWPSTPTSNPTQFCQSPNGQLNNNPIQHPQLRSQQIM